MFENFVVQLAVQDRGLNIEDCPLIDEIIFLEVYHNDILKQIIDKGILVGDEKYIFFTATTGQVRNKAVTLIKESFYKKHQEELTLGLSRKVINSKGGINIGKYLAYNALSLSSSVLPEKCIDIEKCIVVPDLETVITDWVKYIDIKETDAGQCYIADMPKEYVLKPVPVKHTDGEYDGKSKSKKRKKITFNMNKILEISGAKSYLGSLKRFAETKGIYVENQKDKVKIKFDLPCYCQDRLFTVFDIFNSMVYLKAYENKKEVKQCVICSKDFIKTSGNQKTCGSKKCQEALHSLSQAKVNERLKKQAV